MHEDEAAPVRLKTKFHKRCSPAPWLGPERHSCSAVHTHGMLWGTGSSGLPTTQGCCRFWTESQSQGQAMYSLCVTPFVDRILAALDPFHIPLHLTSWKKPSLPLSSQSWGPLCQPAALLLDQHVAPWLFFLLWHLLYFFEINIILRVFGMQGNVTPVREHSTQGSNQGNQQGCLLITAVWALGAPLS